jgi:hypothetical protein
MDDYLIIGLYPTQPIPGSDFTGYLDGLMITAYEVEFNSPDPIPDSTPPHPEIGSATYNVPGQTDTIYQPLFTPKSGPQELAAAAAAVIPVPQAIVNQYTSPESLINVVLSVQRNNVTLVDHSINYDVRLDASLTPPTTLALDGTIGLYLALTDPALDNTAYLLPPSDGTPPAYNDLDTAIKAILAEDPASAVNRANLSPADCLHIARELVSNRTVRPLPAPLVGVANPPATVDLANLYSSDGTGTDTDRAQFQGALQGYYSQLSGDANRMAGYVYAWSMARRCHELTRSAANAAISVPVLLNSPGSPGLQAKATVVLGN